MPCVASGSGMPFVIVATFRIRSLGEVSVSRTVMVLLRFGLALTTTPCGTGGFLGSDELFRQVLGWLFAKGSWECKADDVTFGGSM